MIIESDSPTPYEDISDPDVTAWECPTCGHQTYHAYGFECDACGHGLDRDAVAAALEKRNRAITAAHAPTERL